MNAYRSDVMVGAASKRAIRVRLSMIARERGLSDREIARAMNCGTEALVALSGKHDLSLDWLVHGDLCGPLRMVQWRRQALEATMYP
jgi:hypothetical protein